MDNMLNRLQRMFFLISYAVMIFCMTITFVETIWKNSSFLKYKVSEKSDMQNGWTEQIKSIQKEVYKEFNVQDLLASQCQDHLLAADPSKSTIEIKEQHRIAVGDSIDIKLIIYDGYGNMKTKGGDYLRTRLYNDNLKAYANGEVLDHKNGSYTIRHNALWTGLAKVEIELLYPKEILAAIIRRRHHWHFNDIRAIFESFNTSESTQCHSDKNVFKRNKKGSDLCNFSYWNNTMPWYCLKPVDRTLSCNDLKKYERNWIGYLEGLNECELRLVKRDQYRVGDVINITVGASKRAHKQPNDEMQPCHTYNRSKLWFMKQSTGYFYQGKWILTHCEGRIRNVGECLRNTTVYLWGDSTSLQWLAYLKNLSLGCTLKRISGERWHTRYEAYCLQYNIYIIYIPHNIPAVAGGVSNMSSYFSKTLPEQVKDFKNTSKRIIILHIYSHLQIECIQFFIENVLALRYYLEKLEKMNVTKILIKLPHTHREEKIKGWTIRQPDYIGFLYESIIRKVFTGMHHFVIALNNKDITISTKNIELHPKNIVITAMVEQFLYYVC
ncbi:NXPE family member 2-like isoform X1 [Ruditapes philippinarum]|uniref:NXPE family member 2-like isoform X1 n=2 Tax=Ruditapes philippinarum TaxID=129788 RepID=UPI00295A8344|nr:NXPE family member 2-like isoform X1 [Ruditapes philippinarum]